MTFFLVLSIALLKKGKKAVMVLPVPISDVIKICLNFFGIDILRILFGNHKVSNYSKLIFLEFF